MEFSRPEYWSGQPFPSPGDLPDPGIKPRSPALQADSLPAEPPEKPKNTGVGSLSFLQWIFLTTTELVLTYSLCILYKVLKVLVVTLCNSSESESCSVVSNSL